MESLRAFLALDLSAEVKARIMGVEESIRRIGADVKLVEQENLHVTMKFLGEIRADRLDAVRGAVEGVRARPFELEARGTGAFPSPRMARVLWVGVGRGSEEAKSIFRQLESGLVGAGFPKERDYTPHITIGRVRSQRGGGQLMEALSAFRSTSFGITLVDRIVLKKSQLTPTGPIYTNILEADLRP